MAKYKNRKMIYDGLKFDSEIECKRYVFLKGSQKRGIIKNLEIQPKYTLLDGFSIGGKRFRPITYTADFRYDLNGRHIVEDVKGYETDVFKLKRKMFRAKYGVDISVVYYSGGVWHE